jgi:putative hemolysin
MEILILLLLILINGLFAMSEMSIVSSRKARLQQRVDAGSKGAAVALRMADDPGRFLSTVQVGITTIGILSGAFGENAIAEKLIAVFDTWPAVADYSKLLATVIMVVLVTYCSVVLGELVPKRLALLNPERVAALLAPPMEMLSRLAHPLVALFSLSSNGLLRLLGGQPVAQPSVSEDEIRVMLQQGTAEGVFAKTEEAMVGNVFKLDDLRVTAIMTPRLDIRFLDVEDGIEENHRVLIEGKYQTLPVCRGSLDDVLGLLDAKDFLARTLRNEQPRIEDAMHATVFVPETISTIQLLETLRRRRSHVALIIDEYGSVEGMVTLTDLLEAIIGDLPGAEPTDASDAVQREDGSWLLDGMISLDRVSELLRLTHSLDSDEHDYHTLGGLVMDQLGRVPATGDQFNAHGLRFEVVDMDGNRVDRVLVSHLDLSGKPSVP